MKRITYLAIGLCLTLASCNDYLNINVDPDSPTNTTATVAARLPAVQHAVAHTYGTAAHFTALIEQHITLTNRGNDRYGGLAQWDASGSNPRTASTYPYQIFFISAGGNFNDLYEKAENEGAYHYMGAVKFFRAAGFMAMTDIYGEIPYTYALGETLNPAFDDGKTIFEGCLKELDEAVELFRRTQEPGATPLADGDSWLDGNADRWIKMCYGFKARWLNNLSKKSNLYNPDAVLAALDNAAKSNAESAVVRHSDEDENMKDLWGDPTKTSSAYIWLVNWSRIYYVTQWYADLLTDFDGKGVVDPRAFRLIPLVQTGSEKTWTLSDGADMRTDIRLNSKFVEAAYSVETGEWTGSDGKLYVNLRTKGVINPDFAETAADGTYVNSGTFYARPDAPTYLMCYPELCFIRAEALLRKGDKTGAFAAYQDGIRAHFDLMNEKLQTYNDPNNLSKTPMNREEIERYLNAATGTDADITLGKIIMQKYIALGFSHQNWNDMRRLDYDPQVYRGWTPPYEYLNGSSSKASIPDGSAFRRFRQCVHEFNYNNDNVGASHPAALQDNIYSCPVWWDTAE
ncbi:MAG: SusD/RagB family nutrient-binding outer membrane lipoprotein [Tannerella sp.]|nr:SusD/RagB family nutrient-binding outer membrane lipoprotein [Tannerella sp.]